MCPNTTDQTTSSLSPDERAELEALRKEKEARDRQKELLAIADAESLKRAKKQVLPSEDLAMPPVEKVLIVLSAIIFVFAIIYIVFAP